MSNFANVHSSSRYASILRYFNKKKVPSRAQNPQPPHYILNIRDGVDFREFIKISQVMLGYNEHRVATHGLAIWKIIPNSLYFLFISKIW